MSSNIRAATAAPSEPAPRRRSSMRLPGRTRGIASGILNAARQACGAIGVALLGTLRAGAALVSGVHLAMAVSAEAFLIAAIVTACTVTRRPRQGPIHRLSSW